MGVIGHLDVGVQLHAAATTGLLQDLEIKSIVAFVEEAGIPIVATLNDVSWDTRKIHAGFSGHCSSFAIGSLIRLLNCTEH